MARRLAAIAVAIGLSPLLATPASAATVAAGHLHTCVAQPHGTVVCWGAGQVGQLGNGASEDSVDPVPVTGLTDAVAVSIGGLSTCAIRATGAVSCWGQNSSGELGNGTTTSSSVPVPVVGITDAVELAMTGGTSCARHATGAVSCWGSNSTINGFGLLGNGVTGAGGDSPVPVTVTGLSDAVSISRGMLSGCAVRATGGVVCWGTNLSGELGNGTSGNGTNSAVPVPVTGLTDALSVATGMAHSCALRAGGKVSCWGSNWRGTLGAAGPNSSVPLEVAGINDATAVVATSAGTCALLSTGSLKCWGDNGYGQYADGTYVDASAPVASVGLSDVVAISALGNWHVCATLANRTVSCWGSNAHGELGDGTTTERRATPGLVECVVAGTGTLVAPDPDASPCVRTPKVPIAEDPDPAPEDDGDSDDSDDVETPLIGDPGPVGGTDQVQRTPTPTPSPTPQPAVPAAAAAVAPAPPVPTPAPKLAGPTAALSKGKLTLTAFGVPAAKSGKCRSTATITLTSGPVTVFKTVKVKRAADGTCVLNRTFTLTGRLASAKQLTIGLKGKKASARRVQAA